MGDVIVQEDLDYLSSDLAELIGAFEGALDLQNEDKGLWGQLNANLSMGDFAANWTIHRNEMVAAMKAFKQDVDTINEIWATADQQLSQSLAQMQSQGQSPAPSENLTTVESHH